MPIKIKHDVMSDTGTSELMSMKFTCQFHRVMFDQLSCPKRVTHTFPEQCMFDISVAGESQAPVLWDVCVYTDDRKQRTEVSISLPGAQELCYQYR